LLGVTLGQEASFPVGKVDFLTVYPLTFSEFLQATNPRLLDFVQQIETLAPVPDVFLTPLTSLLRQYFVSGGMPESVAAIVGEADAGKSLASRKAILQAYELDFAKHAPARNVIKMLHLWKSIPAQLGRENKKFLYQLARPGARARDYEEALQWLIQAGLFQRVFHCRQPNIPLAAYDDLNIFKIYLHDTGLLATHAGLDAATLLAGNRLFTEFKGALTENYVLQSLQTQLENQPRYWTSDGQAEIDLLIEYRGRVIPVEIKAEENTKSKSLLVYRQRFQPEVAIRFSMKNLSFENGLLTIPLPLADLTTRFLDLVL
jgi:predicted AAA+ superfamily ATPase